jgi:hypothetical protein
MHGRMADNPMDGKPLEGLLILFLWVALLIAYDRLGEQKRIPRNPSEKSPPRTSTKLPFRFSLRTLLIATTLVAVSLGVIVWAVR